MSVVIDKNNSKISFDQAKEKAAEATFSK